MAQRECQVDSEDAAMEQKNNKHGVDEGTVVGYLNSIIGASEEPAGESVEEIESTVQILRLSQPYIPKANEVLIFRDVHVAGVTYDGRQNLLRDLDIRGDIKLEKDPENPYDPNAVKILSETGEQLGFVPKDIAATLSEIPEENLFAKAGWIVKKGYWGMGIDIYEIIALPGPENLERDDEATGLNQIDDPVRISRERRIIEAPG